MTKRKEFYTGTDIKTIYTYDAVENRDVIKRVQECDPIIQEIKEIKEFSDGRGNTSLGYFVGRIPGTIVEDYIQRAGITFQEFCNNQEHIMRIVNNRDYKQFRIFEGKV